MSNRVINADKSVGPKIDLIKRVRNFSSGKILYIPRQHLPQPARNKANKASPSRRFYKLISVTSRANKLWKCYMYEREEL